MTRLIIFLLVITGLMYSGFRVVPKSERKKLLREWWFWCVAFLFAAFAFLITWSFQL